MLLWPVLKTAPVSLLICTTSLASDLAVLQPSSVAVGLRVQSLQEDQAWPQMPGLP